MEFRNQRSKMRKTEPKAGYKNQNASALSQLPTWIFPILTTDYPEYPKILLLTRVSHGLTQSGLMYTPPQ